MNQLANGGLRASTLAVLLALGACASQSERAAPGAAGDARPPNAVGSDALPPTPSTQAPASIAGATQTDSAALGTPSGGGGTPVAAGANQVAGTVVAVDATARPLAVQPDGGAAPDTYYVAEDTDITFRGAGGGGTLADIRTGDGVLLEFEEIDGRRTIRSLGNRTRTAEAATADAASTDTTADAASTDTTAGTASTATTAGINGPGAAAPPSASRAALADTTTAPTSSSSAATADAGATGATGTMGAAGSATAGAAAADASTESPSRTRVATAEDAAPDETADPPSRPARLPDTATSATSLAAAGGFAALLAAFGIRRVRSRRHD